MRFDTVVFDLDGTISKSGPGITASAEYALKQMGFPIPENLEAFVGPPLYESFTTLCGMNDAQANEAIALYRRRHNDIGWKETQIYPGMFELLCALKKSGAYVALASSKNKMLCERTLEYFGLRDLFDAVCTPDERNLNADKSVFIRSAVPVGAESVCMVGDRMYDMRGAKNAGVYAIGVSYGYGSEEELKQSGADEICQSVPSLRRALLGDAPLSPGRFITFEGSDGCGKSTQHRLAYEYLLSCGIDTVSTREPGGCPISERIRGVLLDVSSMGMTDECEALLFAAARSQHVHDTIKPALERGAVVLCDRFVDSSVAYQGAGRQLGDWVKRINERAVDGCLPDMTLVFDLSPEEAIARRNAATGADRIELSKDDFRKRVYDRFMAMCESGEKRYVKVDATGTIEQIQADVRQKVIKMLKGDIE